MEHLHEAIHQFNNTATLSSKLKAFYDIQTYCNDFEIDYHANDNAIQIGMLELGLIWVIISRFNHTSFTMQIYHSHIDIPHILK